MRIQPSLRKPLASYGVAGRRSLTPLRRPEFFGGPSPRTPDWEFNGGSPRRARRDRHPAMETGLRRFARPDTSRAWERLLLWLSSGAPLSVPYPSRRHDKRSEPVDVQSYGEDWLAAQVRAGREQVSAGHLQMRGYEVFLPCYRERRAWSDRVKTVERALFSGYLFVRPSGAELAKMISAPGVIRLVGDGRQPLPIAAAEIENIQRVVGTGARTLPWPFLHAGQKVRIEVGPLRGAEGIVVRAKGSDRLVVSVPILQRSVAVELQAAWVTAPLSADWCTGPRVESARRSLLAR